MKFSSKPSMLFSFLFILFWIGLPFVYLHIINYFFTLTGNPLTTSEFVWFALLFYVVLVLLGNLSKTIFKNAIKKMENHSSKIYRFLSAFVVLVSLFMLAFGITDFFSSSFDLSLNEIGLIAISLSCFRVLYFNTILSFLKKHLPTPPNKENN